MIPRFLSSVPGSNYAEETEGQFHAFEFNWKTGKKVGFPKQFSEAYIGASKMTVTPENFRDFVGVG
jgi:hypothetical protein